MGDRRATVLYVIWLHSLLECTDLKMINLTHLLMLCVSLKNVSVTVLSKFFHGKRSHHTLGKFFLFPLSPELLSQFTVLIRLNQMIKWLCTCVFNIYLLWLKTLAMVITSCRRYMAENSIHPINHYFFFVKNNPPLPPLVTSRYKKFIPLSDILRVCIW